MLERDIFLQQFDVATQVVLAEVHDTLLKKQKLYGPLSISSLGVKGVFCRTWDKVNRLKSLVWDGASAEGTDEAAADTWKDLIGYAVIGYILQTGKWPDYLGE